MKLIPEDEKDIIYFHNDCERCNELFDVILLLPEFVQNTLSWRNIGTDVNALAELQALPVQDGMPGHVVPTMVIRRPGATRGIHVGVTNIVHWLKQRVGKR